MSIGFSVLLALNIVCLGINYYPLAKTGDSMRVASYLMVNEAINQPILVFNSEVEMVLSHYYDGVNSLIPLPQKEDFQSFSMEDLTLRSEQQIVAALGAISDSTDQIWLVTDNGVLAKLPTYEESYQILETFVRDHYRVEIDQAFYGARVRLMHPFLPLEEF